MGKEFNTLYISRVDRSKKKSYKMYFLYIFFLKNRNREQKKFFFFQSHFTNL